VIAIENVRLFTELQEKNQALTKAHAQVTEALEQQTATSEILRVISSSPTDAQPVFDAIARNAMRLCDAAYSVIGRFDGQLLHLAAHAHVRKEGVEAVERRFPLRPTRAITSTRAILDRTVVHVPDVLKDPEYDRSVALAIQNRTTLAVPMLHDGEPIGSISVGRLEPRPFSGKQIELLRTFADQAVIAIENVRLFTQLQTRNRELGEALEHQTATAEILRVISSSPTDVQPVMDTVAANAARVCGANDAFIFRVDGDALRLVAHYGSAPTTRRIGERIPLTRGTVFGRAVADRQTIHIEDLATTVETDFPEHKDRQRLTGIRTVLATPLPREGVPIGGIMIRRLEVRPFTDKQIALLQTFADQAVIAIENVRLFSETKAALEQQSATSEVLRVISSSPTGIQPVFDTIRQERRAPLCRDVWRPSSVRW